MCQWVHPYRRFWVGMWTVCWLCGRTYVLPPKSSLSSSTKTLLEFCWYSYWNTNMWRQWTCIAVQMWNSWRQSWAGSMITVARPTIDFPSALLTILVKALLATLYKHFLSTLSQKWKAYSNNLRSLQFPVYLLGLKSGVSAFLTPCYVTVGCQRFGGPCCVRLQGEDHDLNLHSRENLKSLIHYGDKSRMMRWAEHVLCVCV
jgi:hypothetical protein